MYHVLIVNYIFAMKRFYGLISDVLYFLGLQTRSLFFLMKSLEVKNPERVIVKMTMSRHQKQVVEKPRVMFEDHEAIADLKGYAFSDISTIKNFLDIN